LEREATEPIRDELEAGFRFALADVEKEQLLEIRGCKLTSRRVDEIKQELLAFIEHHEGVFK
jgi:hypothetical protein